MGVDYYTCWACGKTYSDCGPCGMCEGCDADLCGDCLDKSVAKYGDGDDVIDKCIVCQKDVVTNDALVPFLLEKLGWTRDKGEQEIRKK